MADGDVAAEDVVVGEVAAEVVVVGEVAAEDVATKDHVIDGDAVCSEATSEGVQANTLTTFPLEQRREPQRAAERTAEVSANRVMARQHGDRIQQQVARLSLVRTTRMTAVMITILIATASFILSFASLGDLAARTAYPGRLSWLWPVIVDGAIILATMALVAFSAYPQQRGSRRYFWVVLGVGALVSVSGNAVHAMIPNSGLPKSALGPWFDAAIACVPPIALVGATHALSILWRFIPYETLDETGDFTETSLARTQSAEQIERWSSGGLSPIQERGLVGAESPPGPSGA
ncbi:hypothetical protein NJB14197_31770 [Mycobacterium montefiorense]|uniref:DUF2637 domain-containing protein n=1 Tax=Mycobacterium montefiorense TaxID=154654 RepID=A0AA37UU75_9MYCO|nr:hypothetical protein NJB14191_36600 [Mycobacterium montefiorense]GKU38079.1 hypothetical protein NJB14192_00780 [Mycobacterium montefiorense]GKU47769.1 hypothetical protein NJB14194_43870 [Mycobacterium montefiorense]GKU53106.1 hypothetical protein NJB14195_43470 [Mycobacterium montefiorense]GKU57317.1 hypothetical protein NJB14197_31770 [Mycobacterium montefiorense]